MMVRLSFTAGSLAGRTFDIPNPGSLSIGRSRTCDVKVTEPDVSGRHLVFRCGVKDCATVEIASARTTLFKGTPVSMGDCRYCTCRYFYCCNDCSDIVALIALVTFVFQS